MPSLRRLFGPSAERSRGPLWSWPALSAAAAIVSALGLGQVRPAPGSALGALWYGDVASAASLLQVVGTAVMTATTLTFSLTIFALQLASQQFSPRLLREFTREPVTKRVLAILVGTFVFALTALRALRSDQPVPTLAVLGGYLLGLVSVGALVGFVAHMVRALRVDTMMLRVHDETNRAIERFYLPYGDQSVRSGEELDLDAGRGRTVAVRSSGFVQTTDVERLVDCAREHDALVRVEVRAGDHVVAGSPVATVWARGEPAREVEEHMAEAVRAALLLSYERTLDQDAAFGFRQLEDIAVKAMSPGINDPVTAATAVGHMADLLVQLTDRRLGPTLHEDPDGVGRVIVPDRDLRYYLELACGQLRRFAAAEPTVLMALLRMLRDTAAACRDDDQREEIARSAHLVASARSPDLHPTDAEAVQDMCARVERALAGDVREAYRDRAGETRSI